MKGVLILPDGSKRFFELKNQSLTYYIVEGGTSEGEISVTDGLVESYPNNEQQLMLTTLTGQYLFQAPTKEKADQWVAALEVATGICVSGSPRQQSRVRQKHQVLKEGTLRVKEASQHSKLQRAIDQHLVFRLEDDKKLRYDYQGITVPIEVSDGVVEQDGDLVVLNVLEGEYVLQATTCEEAQAWTELLEVAAGLLPGSRRASPRWGSPNSSFAGGGSVCGCSNSSGSSRQIEGYLKVNGIDKYCVVSGKTFSYCDNHKSPEMEKTFTLADAVVDYGNCLSPKLNQDVPPDLQIALSAIDGDFLLEAATLPEAIKWADVLEQVAGLCSVKSSTPKTPHSPLSDILSKQVIDDIWEGVPRLQSLNVIDSSKITAMSIGGESPPFSFNSSFASPPKPGSSAVSNDSFNHVLQHIRGDTIKEGWLLLVQHTVSAVGQGNSLCVGNRVYCCLTTHKTLHFWATLQQKKELADPILIVSLQDAVIEQHITNEQQATQLILATMQGEFVLDADTKDNAKRWIHALEVETDITKTASQYIGRSPRTPTMLPPLLHPDSARGSLASPSRARMSGYLTVEEGKEPLVPTSRWFFQLHGQTLLFSDTQTSPAFSFTTALTSKPASPASPSLLIPILMENQNNKTNDNFTHHKSGCLQHSSHNVNSAPSTLCGELDVTEGAVEQFEQRVVLTVMKGEYVFICDSVDDAVLWTDALELATGLCLWKTRSQRTSPSSFMSAVPSPPMSLSPSPNSRNSRVYIKETDMLGWLTFNTQKKYFELQSQTLRYFSTEQPAASQPGSVCHKEERQEAEGSIDLAHAVVERCGLELTVTAMSGEYTLSAHSDMEATIWLKALELATGLCVRKASKATRSALKSSSPVTPITETLPPTKEGWISLENTQCWFRLYEDTLTYAADKDPATKCHKLDLQDGVVDVGDHQKSIVLTVMQGEFILQFSEERECRQWLDCLETAAGLAMSPKRKNTSSSQF